MAEQHPHRWPGLCLCSPVETNRKALYQGPWGSLWEWEPQEAHGDVWIGSIPPPQPGNREQGTEQHGSWHLCLSQSSSEMLMFELLFQVCRGRKTCLSHMQQMCLQGIVSAGDWKSVSNPQEYFWNILTQGEDRDHHFCAQRKYILAEKPLKTCTGFPSKLAPLLGPGF